MSQPSHHRISGGFSPWPSVAYQATAFSFRAQCIVCSAIVLAIIAVIHQVALIAPEGLR
jgi:hypothetical protein